MSEIKNLTNEDNILDQIMSLKGEERIFVTIDAEASKELQHLFYKRQALNNLFMSYMNNTAEQASQMSLEALVDRYAQSYVKESDVIATVGIGVLGKELYDYLSHSHSPHYFIIDYLYHQLIILPRSATASVGVCTCGQCKI